LLIATPNIAIDRTVRLPELRPGSVLRPSVAVATAGGKGVNVSRVAAALGHPASLVGFRPDADAATLDRLFAAEPVRFVAIPVPGEVRVATIYLEDSGRVTVLNEPGPLISAGSWASYEQLVATELAAGQHQTLVCTGSLAVGPDVVTPNLAEAEGLCEATSSDVAGLLYGHSEEATADSGPDVALRACAPVRALCGRGARAAAVTAGAAGAAFGDASEVFWVPTAPAEVVNPIGAGDSFVAGLVEALEAGRTSIDAVVFAVATATASVEQERAGALDPERARQIAAYLAGTARPERDLIAQAAGTEV
jgi:fructose-1-phosphate kinase PfkB-like protein